MTERPLGLARVDGHLILVNSAGMEASEAAGQTGVETDDAGAPTGRLTGNAGQAAKRWFSTNLSDHDVEELQLAAASLAVAHGVTTIHEMSMPADRGMRDLEILLAHRSRLPLDVVSYVATTDISTVMDLGLPRIGGDLPVDGSIGARTASVSGGFVDRARARRATSATTSSRSTSTTVISRACRWGSTRSATPRSSRWCGHGSASISRSTPGSGVTSGPAATASSISRWRAST